MTDSDEGKKPDRTLRRMLIILGIVLLVGGGYVLYRKIMVDRVSSKLEAIRAQGFPASGEELNEWYAEPPPGQNAAFVFERAFSHDVDVSETAGDLPVVGEAQVPSRGEPLPEEMKENIWTYLKENKDALDLLHEAAAMEQCRYPIDMRMGPATLLPHLAPLRHGARLLKLEAILHAEEGRADEAAESVIASLGLARSLSKEPILISQLVRIACLALTCSSLEYALNRVPLAEEPLARLSKALVEAEDPEGLTRAFVGERAQGADMFTRSGQIGPTFVLPGPAFLALKTTGLLDADFKHYLEIMNDCVEATRVPVEERQAAFEAVDVEKKVRNLPKYCFLTHMLVPALARAETEFTKSFARLRTARAAVAVEQYRLAKGLLPETLEDLTPEYLDAVPLDPFDGKPLRYKKLEKGYVVYSIGEDETDDGAPPPPEDSEGRTIRYREKDITFIVER